MTSDLVKNREKPVDYEEVMEILEGILGKPKEVMKPFWGLNPETFPQFHMVWDDRLLYLRVLNTRDSGLQIDRFMVNLRNTRIEIGVYKEHLADLARLTRVRQGLLVFQRTLEGRSLALENCPTDEGDFLKDVICEALKLPENVLYTIRSDERYIREISIEDLKEDFATRVSEIGYPDGSKVESVWVSARKGLFTVEVSGSDDYAWIMKASELYPSLY